MRPRSRAGKIALAGVLAGIACVLLALLAIVVTWPRLLAPLLGLRAGGSLAAELPPDSAPLILDGAPLAQLAQVEFLLPPHVTEPAALTIPDVGEASFSGEAATPGASNYLLTMDGVALNHLVRRWLLPNGAKRGQFRDLWISLQPGGLILFADLSLGLGWQPAGLMLVQDGAELRPARVVLGNESYALPDGGLVSGRAASVATYVERVLGGLVITGPLPGEARVSEVRIHQDRIDILAQATYPVPHSPDTGWQPLQAGVELRQMDVTAQYGTERATIVRLDPALVRFRVRYAPDSPRRLSAWAAQSGALLAINGGFFTPQNDAIGLVVSGGQRWGTSLGDFAGMFAVTPEGQVSVRWLNSWPYAADEPLSEAVQAFPVLVKPGGHMGFPAGAGDDLPDRRTVIAEDRAGNILVLVMPGGHLSLHELATFLATSDMNLDIALNLDGGGSTGLWLAAGEREIEIDSVTPLSVVIFVDMR